MRLRLAVVMCTIGLVAWFTVINWAVLMEPASLSLGLSSMQVPLGLFMLAIATVIVLALVVYMAFWQSKILWETRLHVREMQKLRAIAEKAEASRLTDLQNTLLREVERSRESLREEIHSQANSLAAMLGEIEDRQASRSRN